MSPAQAIAAQKAISGAYRHITAAVRELRTVPDTVIDQDVAHTINDLINTKERLRMLMTECVGYQYPGA